MIKAIIGLGNPGSRFAWTRHNIGFHILDEIALIWHGKFEAQDDKEICKVTVPEDVRAANSSLAPQIFLVKPTTFMNNSGWALPALARKGIKADEILVVHDELEKKFGSISIKKGGSARGHNGLKSVIAALGDGFWRLRFGIDRPVDRDDVADYVLAQFSPDERAQLPLLCLEALEQVTRFNFEG